MVHSGLQIVRNGHVKSLKRLVWVMCVTRASDWSYIRAPGASPVTDWVAAGASVHGLAPMALIGVGANLPPPATAMRCG